MDHIVKECPKCGSKLKISESALGKPKRCPYCKDSVRFESTPEIILEAELVSESLLRKTKPNINLIVFFSVCFVIIVAVSFGAFYERPTNKKHTSKPSIPKYKIVQDKKGSGVRQVATLLPFRITKSQLQKVVVKIHSETPSDFHYCSIQFYVSNIPFDNGCWAAFKYKAGTTSELKINGLTPDKIDILLDAEFPPADKIIGTWYFETNWSVPYRVVLYKKGSSFFKELLKIDQPRSPEIKPMNQSLNETKFEYQEPAFEYYFINSEGELETHHPTDGCFATGKKRSSLNL